ncbi:MAG TPA: Hsp20/alpha crystallin family protein [Chromatiales bacterium]|nr:Hsp20/alpha crystallin family protein [Chromatiales bacterium]
MMKHFKITNLAILLFIFIGAVQAQPPVQTQGAVGIFTHQWRDANNYYLGVLLNGITPDELQVTPRARMLTISAQKHQKQAGQGGFASSGQSVQRSVPLPWDADVQNMQRKITGKDVVIVIPRRKN